MFGKQFADLRDVHGGQTPEHVGQVVLRVDAAASAADDQRVDDRTAPTGVRVPNKEPAPATHGGNADRVFDEIIVDPVVPRLQISRDGLVFVEQIAYSLAEAALG